MSGSRSTGTSTRAFGTSTTRVQGAARSVAAGARRAGRSVVELMDALGIATFIDEDYEADDLIATVDRPTRANGEPRDRHDATRT